MSAIPYFSFLQAGFTVHGDIVSDHGLTCVGLVDGNITSTNGLVHIAKGSVVRGNVVGEHVVLDGTVEGEIRARASVLLNGRAKGRVIYGGTIRLGESADLEGTTLSRAPILEYTETTRTDTATHAETIS
uniref:bactofilin family protein n=1 Tax=Cupriavidus taiwanensis TaxID=164546 RepID=UPI003F493C67